MAEAWRTKAKVAGRRGWRSHISVLILGVLGAGCASPRAPGAAPGPSPAPTVVVADSRGSVPTTRSASDVAAVASPLSAIPLVDGPLAVKVVYPEVDHRLTVRDSNYIIGSVGSGNAQLTINGVNVPVLPNGAFLGWLAIPSGAKPVFDLVATKGAERATGSREVTALNPVLVLPDTGKLIIDRGSVSPVNLTVRPDEHVRVSLRAPHNAEVVLRSVTGENLPLYNNGGTLWSREVPASQLAASPAGSKNIAHIVAIRGADSITVALTGVKVTDPNVHQYLTLIAGGDQAANDTDAVAILRPTPSGTYKWFLLPQTIVELTGQSGEGALRVRLDNELEAWVDAKNTRNMLPHGSPAPRRVASNARVTSTAGYSDLRIPVGDRPAYSVTQTHDAITLTLYGVTANTDIVNLATVDPTIRDVSWEQVFTDRARFTIHLRHPPVGYLVLWDRNAIVLRVRHAPAIDPNRPLAGRTIVVDPGHPPIGATGPLGSYEGDIVLMVAEELKPILEARGATVVMTRTTRSPVALNERPAIARRANGDAFVSIHLNAHGDGVNPYRLNGSGTYFFQGQSEPLARAVQSGMVRQMGLRDLGINYDNLAVVRQTWMPAILCEGAFVVVPEQEAALLTAEFRRKYATGIADGLVEYFSAIGKNR